MKAKNKKLDDSSIKALISLLEDPNEEIFKQIQETVICLGDGGIVPLQMAFDTSQSRLQKNRIRIILDDLKLKKLSKDLKYWYAFNSRDLLSGMLDIAAYGYPDFDREQIKGTLNQIEDELRTSLVSTDPTEIVRTMNQTILYDFGFNGNIGDYTGIDNSFLNKIIERRVGNPIGLSVIYLLIAERLDLPLIGINTPRRFLLGYVGGLNGHGRFRNKNIMQHIDFFIDPFNNGRTIKMEELDRWLLLVQYRLQDKKYLPATNESIIQRVVNNLIYALFTVGEKSTARQLLDINESIAQ